MYDKKHVTIMRGIPGSGKSTYIKYHIPDAYVCSADDHMINSVGVYEFDRKRLGAAHRACYNKFHMALDNSSRFIGGPNTKYDHVVVDNTNTQLFEFYGYMQLAWSYGREVRIIRMDTPVDIASARNIHGVPTNNVKAMQDRFQSLPSFLDINEFLIKGI